MVKEDVKPPVVCPFCSQTVDDNVTRVIHSYAGMEFSDMRYHVIHFILHCGNCTTTSKITKKTGKAEERQSTYKKRTVSK